MTSCEPLLETVGRRQSGVNPTLRGQKFSRHGIENILSVLRSLQEAPASTILSRWTLCLPCVDDRYGRERCRFSIPLLDENQRIAGP